MLTLHIKGRLLPENPVVNHKTHWMTYQIPDLLDMKYQISVKDNLVEMNVELSQPDNLDNEEFIFTQIGLAAQRHINILGFQCGIGFLVHLESCASSSGDKLLFTPVPAPIPGGERDRVTLD